MTRPEFLLICGEPLWQVIRVAEDKTDCRQIDVRTPPQYSLLTDALEQLEWKREDVCLGLPSAWVYSARVSVENLRGRHRQTALLYRLEEHLPLEAESLTADCVPGSGGQALAVGVKTDQVKPILAALAEAGIEVACIQPAGLLALWACGVEEHRPHLGILVDGGWADVFRIAQQRPASWVTVPSQPDEVLQAVNVSLLLQPVSDGPARAVLAGASSQDMAGLLRERAGVEVRQLPQTVAELAGLAAAEALAGGPAGWVDLRRGPLARGGRLKRLRPHLSLAFAATAALLISVIAGCLWRAHGYDLLTAELERQQAREYQRALPNRALPAHVPDALRAEAQKLAGISGSGSMAVAQNDALGDLRRVMTCLPPDLRLRVVDLRLGPSDLMIEGQMRSHGDAEILAQTLRRGRMEIENPRTESARGGGVSFSLAGKPVAAEAPPAGKGGGK